MTLVHEVSTPKYRKNPITYAQYNFPKTFTVIYIIKKVTGKVNLSLSAPWRHVWGVEVWLHSFLSWTPDGDEWSILHPGRSTHGEEPRCLLYSRLGGPQGRSGRLGEKYIVPAGSRATRLCNL